MTSTLLLTESVSGRVKFGFAFAPHPFAVKIPAIVYKFYMERFRMQRRNPIDGVGCERTER